MRIAYAAALLLAACTATARAQSISTPSSIEARHFEGSGAEKHLTGWTSYPVRSYKSLAMEAATIPLDKFGGRTDRHGTRTDFFHSERIGNRWWLVDPLGNLYLNNGVASVEPGTSEKTRAALTSSFGSEEKWMTVTHRQLLEDGNNGLGAWSNIDLLLRSPLQATRPLAYTINLDIMSAYGAQRGGTTNVPGHKAYPEDTIFVFDPAFEAFARSYVAKSVQHATDPNLLGYFSDNEIPLLLKNLDGFLRLPIEDAGHIAAQRWMNEHHATTATDKLRAEFLEFEASRYFAIVADAIHRADPNHMYLGCRFYGSQLRQPELFRAAGAFAGVVSINVYNIWEPSTALTDMWQKEAGKPFMVTEFYAKAEDSGMPNLTGAGWLVHTQNDRGLFYQNFAMALLQSRGCVGWHWFKYQDNDPDDPKAELSNKDSNKGIVSNVYKPYDQLLTMMREFNLRMYAVADALDNRN